jgi:hypothetical protein
MQTKNSIVSKAESTVLPVASPVPVDVLVKQVYEAAQPNVRNRMLHLLVGHAYAASPPLVRQSLLEQLIRSVGVLGLVTVAGGVFAKIRLRGRWPDIAVRLDDLQDIRTPDVVALVDYVQRVSAEALIDAIKLLANNPALIGSGAVALLMSIMLQRVPDRRRVPRENS